MDDKLQVKKLTIWDWR